MTSNFFNSLTLVIALTSNGCFGLCAEKSNRREFLKQTAVETAASALVVNGKPLNFVATTPPAVAAPLIDIVAFQQSIARMGYKNLLPFFVRRNEALHSGQLSLPSLDYYFALEVKQLISQGVSANIKNWKVLFGNIVWLKLHRVYISTPDAQARVEEWKDAMTGHSSESPSFAEDYANHMLDWTFQSRYAHTLITQDISLQRLFKKAFPNSTVNTANFEELYNFIIEETVRVANDVGVKISPEEIEVLKRWSLENSHSDTKGDEAPLRREQALRNPAGFEHFHPDYLSPNEVSSLENTTRYWSASTREILAEFNEPLNNPQRLIREPATAKTISETNPQEGVGQRGMLPGATHIPKAPAAANFAARKLSRRFFSGLFPSGLDLDPKPLEKRPKLPIAVSPQRLPAPQEIHLEAKGNVIEAEFVASKREAPIKSHATCQRDLESPPK